MTTPSETPASRTELNVLVVDDDEDVLDLICSGLTALGFHVRRANNGMHAVDLYRQHRGDIDVVLLDVRMPGLDGPLTLQALKRLDAGVRVVFMTGYTGDYSAEELLALGAAGFLAKPFSLAALADALRRACQPTAREP